MELAGHPVAGLEAIWCGHNRPRHPADALAGLSGAIQTRGTDVNECGIDDGRHASYRIDGGGRPRPPGRGGGEAAARGEGRLEEVEKTSDIWGSAWDFVGSCDLT